MSTSHVALGKGDASSLLSQSHNNSRVGDGFREDWPIDLGSWRDAAYLGLTGGTTPIAEISAGQAQLRWAASDSHAITASMRIDGCAQQTWSEYQLVADFLQSGSTDTITVKLEATASRPGAGTIGKFTVTRTITLGNTNSCEEIFFNFSELVDASKHRLQPGDVVTFTLTPGTHTTDNLILLGSGFRRARNPALTYVGLGNDGANASGKDHRFVDYGAT